MEDLRRHKYLFVKGRQSHWTHKIWNKKYIYCFYETHFSNMVTKIAPIDFDDIRKTLLKSSGVIFILSKKFSSWIPVMKYEIWRIWDVINIFCKNRFSRFHCRQERFWIDFRTSTSRWNCMIIFNIFYFHTHGWGKKLLNLGVKNFWNCGNLLVKSPSYISKSIRWYHLDWYKDVRIHRHWITSFFPPVEKFFTPYIFFEISFSNSHTTTINMK